MTELTIEQHKDGKFVDLIVVNVIHTPPHSLGNGNYLRPDDWESGTVDEVTLDGIDITEEFFELGFYEDDIIYHCEGVNSNIMKTEIDISELSKLQLNE